MTIIADLLEKYDIANGIPELDAEIEELDDVLETLEEQLSDEQLSEDERAELEEARMTAAEKRAAKLRRRLSKKLNKANKAKIDKAQEKVNRLNAKSNGKNPYAVSKVDVDGDGVYDEINVVKKDPKARKAAQRAAAKRG